MSTEFLAPLLSVLKKLVAWLREGNVSGMVIGGVAVSFLGRPRLTRDIDVIVWLDNELWEEFLNKGEKFGFFPRIENPIIFAQKSRVLLINHKLTGIDIDISFGVLPFEEEAINRAVYTKISGIDIPLPTPEDLVIMKAVAHRPIDMADIQSIMDANPEVDLKRIRKWVKEFSIALEMPEIFNEVEKILTQLKKGMQRDKRK